MMRIIRKVVEETDATQKVIFEIDARNTTSHDYVSIRKHINQLTIEDDSGQLINISLSPYAQINIVISIDVNNAPNYGE